MQHSSALDKWAKNNEQHELYYGFVYEKLGCGASSNLNIELLIHLKACVRPNLFLKGSWLVVYGPCSSRVRPRLDWNHNSLLAFRSTQFTFQRNEKQFISLRQFLSRFSTPPSTHTPTQKWKTVISLVTCILGLIEVRSSIQNTIEHFTTRPWILI